MNAPLPAVSHPPLPPTWTTGSTEVFKTGTWRTALARHVSAPSPCHQACPLNGDIAEWIGLARARDWHGAWQVLTRHNPFPATIGRVCHHPCESACNRAGFDQPLSICALERFVGDQALAAGWAFAPPVVERDGHVAVVGGGPSGLSAAFQLRRLGWRVTLYERSAMLGGLMRHGIPAYRLAREVLDAEIARIVALGIELRCGAALDTPQQFAALRAAHDAVFVATGAGQPKRLPQFDAGAPWLLDGAAYLAAANAGTPPALGPAVVVVGGGSAAFDAARSARRAGHAVTLLALESREQLPAQADEVAEALEEGVALLCGAMLQSVQTVQSVQSVQTVQTGQTAQTAQTAQAGQTGQTGQAVHEGPGGLRLECRRVRFEPGPVRDQFELVPLDSRFEIAADAVLCSIGQDPELALFGGALPLDGGLVAAARDGGTGAAGVWAGGDLSSMERFVSAAIGMGKRAALAIDRRLRGAPDDAVAEGAAVPLAAIATWYHDPAARAPAAKRLPSERHGGLEVQLGLEIEAALAESERCFSCGQCIACDNCVSVCPDLAVRPLGGTHYEVLADYCKGCGLCVRECPTGSMAMQEEMR